MSEDNRVKYTTYLASGIEHVSKKEMIDWRDEMTMRINSEDLLIYNPVAQESNKVGRPSGEHVEYIRGLKRAGHMDLFYDEMWKIWNGKISKNTDIMQMLINLRMRKHIDGNCRNEIAAWGDAEAVVRSDFLCIYMPEKVRTVGTIWEQFIAMLFRIPNYLILPDVAKTDANSTLIFGVMVSGGKVFYSVKECADYIIDKYNLEIIEQEKK